MKLKSIFSIFFPPIICFIFSYILEKKFLLSSPIYLMPLFFGIVLGIFNYKHYRSKIYFNQVIQVSLIGIIISFLSFVIALFSYLLMIYALDFLIENLSITFGKEELSRLAMFFAIYLIAPLSVLLLFKRVFRYPEGQTTNTLIIVSLIVFTILGCLANNKEITLNNKLSLLWMPLMAFFIQLILYQKNLKALFTSSTKE